MANGSQSITIEGFVTDDAFVDQSKAINGILIDQGALVASLTNKALSYFEKPAVFQDKRVPTTRSANWVPVTAPKLVVDNDAFSTFVSTINNQSPAVAAGFFKIIDKLLFAYDPAIGHAALELFLTTESDIKAIYEPNSFAVSNTIITDTVYLPNAVTKSVNVPAYVNFEINIAVGATTTSFVLKLYASVDAWLQGYNVSEIVKVIPPLPYDVLYDDSLLNSTDNIFATATSTARIAFDSSKVLLGSTTVSGMAEYKAILTDGPNNSSVPFNLLFKGRPPTLFEIRNAIRDALLSSGVGDEAGWTKRIPGVFVDGRFYIIPFWDQTYTKPNQKLFPNLTRFSTFSEITHAIISSLGYGDVTEHIDVLALFYNRMMATVVPDLTGTVDVHPLADLIPDYQSYSPTDPEYGYMLENTQTFIRELNTILAVDSKIITSTVYEPTTEGLLTFYSFTVGRYEMCVITQLCYTTVLGSTQ